MLPSVLSLSQLSQDNVKVRLPNSLNSYTLPQICYSNSTIPLSLYFSVMSVNYVISFKAL